jgi:Protein of unknown function (DUF3572)
MLKSSATSDEASVVALRALAFLAGDGGRLARFLALSGLAPEDLRARAGQAEFLAGVLDHLLADESLLLVFCAEAGLRPDVPARARAELAGGSHGE